MKNPYEFFSVLRERLKEALPGEEAQNRMSSFRSFSTTEYLRRNPAHRKSAVMILLWPEQATVYSLLIRRPEYEGVHSGQMAFPGGSSEPEDVDLVQTAIRETFEEVGVRVNREQVMGPLTPLYIPASNFLVQPFIACLNEKPAFAADPTEVSALLEFDLFLILDPQLKKSKQRIYSNGMKAETPYYDIRGFEVWGATAMITSELSAIVQEICSS